MQALYLKPVQTGFPEDSDARLAVSTMNSASLCDMVARLSSSA